MDRIVRTELDLISHIYDCVLEPGRWNDTLDRIRRYLGLYLGAISVLDLRTGSNIIQATTNIPPEMLPIMAEEGDSLEELWGGYERFSRIPLEEPIRMTDYIPLERMVGNRYYERVGRPLGLVDQIVLALEFNPSMVATFGMGLHESMPAIDEDQLEMVRVLAPHMRRAALISKLLETRAVAAASFEATLDALGSAVMLIDARCRILYANGLAEGFLERSDPIAQLGGKLVIPRELIKGRFEQLIAAAANGEESLRHGGGLPARDTDGGGVVIHVLPLRRRAMQPAPAAVAAVLVAAPEAEINLPLEAMRVLYDLRPAELRVFELIAKGASGNSVAQALAISRNTVKTHTSRLFDKLGVRTRAELVRLAHDMAIE